MDGSIGGSIKGINTGFSLLGMALDRSNTYMGLQTSEPEPEPKTNLDRFFANAHTGPSLSPRSVCPSHMRRRECLEDAQARIAALTYNLSAAPGIDHRAIRLCQTMLALSEAAVAILEAGKPIRCQAGVVLAVHLTAEVPGVRRKYACGTDGHDA